MLYYLDLYYIYLYKKIFSLLLFFEWSLWFQRKGIFLHQIFLYLYGCVCTSRYNFPLLNCIVCFIVLSYLSMI